MLLQFVRRWINILALLLELELMKGLTRIFHRCHVMRAPEAACEHMVSLAHHLWQPSQGLDPSSVVTQLLLAMLQVRLKEASL